MPSITNSASVATGSVERQPNGKLALNLSKGVDLTELNTFQKYFAEEFYDDYRDGLLTRRQFIRRLVYVTGGKTAAIPWVT